MADRRVLACHRITPCGLFEHITHLITLGRTIHFTYRIGMI